MQTLVKNFNKLSRPIIFDGFNSGLFFSDIDFTWEFKNKYLILGEVKEKGKNMLTSQQLFTTRIADAWEKEEGKKALIIFAQHEPGEEVVHLKNCTVSKVYIKGMWKTLKHEITVKEFLNLFFIENNINL